MISAARLSDLPLSVASARKKGRNRTGKIDDRHSALYNHDRRFTIMINQSTLQAKI
jgi:hypothetical protein